FSIVIARAVHIYPICAVLNIHRNPKIPRSYQHMLLFSGLRGAMAFALAYRNTATDNRQIMATTTTMIVILTDDGQSGEGGSGAETPSRVSGQNPWDKAFLPRKWYNFDATFMKPLLTHANPTLMETLPTFCMPFAKLFTTSRQMSLVSFFEYSYLLLLRLSCSVAATFTSLSFTSWWLPADVLYSI
ncbi:Sodium/hydrogen exchanger 9, partial [Toxocara canis]